MGVEKGMARFCVHLLILGILTEFFALYTPSAGNTKEGTCGLNPKKSFSKIAVERECAV